MTCFSDKETDMDHTPPTLSINNQAQNKPPKRAKSPPHTTTEDRHHPQNTPNSSFSPHLSLPDEPYNMIIYIGVLSHTANAQKIIPNLRTWDLNRQKVPTKNQSSPLQTATTPPLIRKKQCISRDGNKIVVSSTNVPNQTPHHTTYSPPVMLTPDPNPCLNIRTSTLPPFHPQMNHTPITKRVPRIHAKALMTFLHQRKH